MPPLDLRAEIRRAIELHRANRLDEAESAYRSCLASDPECVDALHLLGVALRQKGHALEAEPLIRQAISLKAGVAEFHNNLGNVLRDLDRLDDAIAAFRHALALAPTNPALSKNLGETYLAKGDNENVITSFSEAVRLGLQDAGMCNSLGVTLQTKGRFAEAERCFHEAIRLAPRWTAPYSNLGNLLNAAGQRPAAIQAYQAALLLDPNFYQAELNLAVVYADAGELQNALACLHRAIALQPTDPTLHANLAGVLRLSGQSQAALTSYRHAVQLDPANPAIHSSLLQTLHFVSGPTPEEIAWEHRNWAARHASSLYPTHPPPVSPRDASRPLRIGYVSGDFSEHAVMKCFEGILLHHDRRQFSITCYSNSTGSDSTSVRLASLVPQWREITFLSDQETAELVRKDEIDVLVDLNGHTTRNRLLVFARKPAPIQVSYFGYQDTTGLETMDWRITDEVADPSGETDTLYTERLWRLPRISWCYLPNADAPVVSALPATLNGDVTFGCLNDLNKVTPEMIHIWSRILTSIPRSRLHLLASLAGEGAEACLAEFARAGLDPARITRLRRTDVRSYLGYYQQIDIALDTYPYTGCTTTADALWMGVPVVSIAGKSYISRQGLNLLHSVGLQDLIAANADDYVAIACSLARDLPALARLRAELRERMKAAPILDSAGLARDLENAFRQMIETRLREETLD